MLSTKHLNKIKKKMKSTEQPLWYERVSKPNNVHAFLSLETVLEILVSKTCSSNSIKLTTSIVLLEKFPISQSIN